MEEIERKLRNTVNFAKPNLIFKPCRSFPLIQASTGFSSSLDTAHAPHDANGHSSSSTSPALSHSIGPSTSVLSQPPDASNPSLVDEVQQQEQAPTQPLNSSTISESEPHWKVDIIETWKRI